MEGETSIAFAGDTGVTIVPQDFKKILIIDSIWKISPWLKEGCHILAKHKTEVVLIT